MKKMLKRGGLVDTTRKEEIQIVQFCCSKFSDHRGMLNTDFFCQNEVFHQERVGGNRDINEK